MRRFIFASLLTIIAPMVIFSPLASAVTIHKPTKPAVRRPINVETVVTAHTLVADANRLGVSISGLRAEWQHVAVCEVDGNWSMTGPSYSGIGFSNATWDQYGGTTFAPLAGEASEDQQILVGMRVTKSWVPDQDGCTPGGW